MGRLASPGLTGDVGRAQVVRQFEFPQRAADTTGVAAMNPAQFCMVMPRQAAKPAHAKIKIARSMSTLRTSATDRCQDLGDTSA